jgi:hypothetical protein
MNSVCSKSSSEENINPLVANNTHIEGVLDLEDTPVLSSSEISLSFRFLEVVAGDNEEEVPPSGSTELACPEEEMSCVVAEEELSNHQTSDDQELSRL